MHDGNDIDHTDGNQRVANTADAPLAKAP